MDKEGADCVACSPKSSAEAREGHFGEFGGLPCREEGLPVGSLELRGGDLLVEVLLLS
jgi:hypothetical protein